MKRTKEKIVIMHFYCHIITLLCNSQGDAGVSVIPSVNYSSYVQIDYSNMDYPELKYISFYLLLISLKSFIIITLLEIANKMYYDGINGGWVVF